MDSLTLTPSAPWHAEHTMATLALPAATSAAFVMGAARRTAASVTSFFMASPSWALAYRR